jgi:hypothetical protein
MKTVPYKEGIYFHTKTSMESVMHGFLFDTFTCELDCKELINVSPPTPEALPSLPAALSDSGRSLPQKTVVSNQSDICLTAGCVHTGMSLSLWPNLTGYLELVKCQSELGAWCYHSGLL